MFRVEKSEDKLVFLKVEWEPRVTGGLLQWDRDGQGELIVMEVS